MEAAGHKLALVLISSHVFVGDRMLAILDTRLGYARKMRKIFRVISGKGAKM
jgi:hypothetical protein